MLGETSQCSALRDLVLALSPLSGAALPAVDVRFGVLLSSGAILLGDGSVSR